MPNKTLEMFKRICKRALMPIPKMTVSEWADNYRILSSESSAEAGKWRTDRAPYQREIMDSFTDSTVHTVVAKLASQTGKSDMMNNVIGRYAQLDPCPMMMVQPTIDMAQDYSKNRISPMIRDCKELKDIFVEAKSRDSGNTILNKMFPGGRLIMGGANSPAGLASRPIRIVLFDEVDRFPNSAGNEGDPVDLAAKRTTTFWNYKIGLFSTPTTKGASRIEDEYLTGTQEEWQHKCPNCGEFHFVDYHRIETDYETIVDTRGRKHIKVNSVKWRCPDCGFGFTETEMRRSEQKYVAQNPSALEKGIRSFSVNCFSSPWLKWSKVLQEWLEAKGDPEREKVVINTRFAESYEQRGEFDDDNKFLDRRELYEAELPDGVLLLTAGVDVQDNRLEYEVCGWGENEECWGIRKGILLGVPDTKEVWNLLDQQLDREYHFKNGTGLLVSRTFIDSGGHYTKEVYSYCLSHMARQRFAIKGSSQSGVPIIHKYTKAVTVRNRTIPLVLIGTDSGKQYTFDRLSIEVPGPKYFHFPKNSDTGYDEIYFKGLVSEKKVAHKKNGQIVWQWENIAKDKRNEPLDLRVYNLACLKSLNPDFTALKALISGINTPKTAAKQSQNKVKMGKIKGGID